METTEAAMQEKLADIDHQYDEEMKSYKRDLDNLKEREDNINWEIEKKKMNLTIRIGSAGQVSDEDLPNIHKIAAKDGEAREKDVDQMIHTTAEIIKIKNEASKAAREKFRKNFKKIQKDAKDWLEKAKLHKKGHKNTEEFESMMEAVTEFLEVEASNEVGIRAKAAVLFARADHYLDEKNSHPSLIASDLRKTRMLLGQSIKFACGGE